MLMQVCNCHLLILGISFRPFCVKTAFEEHVKRHVDTPCSSFHFHVVTTDAQVTLIWIMSMHVTSGTLSIMAGP